MTLLMNITRWSISDPITSWQIDGETIETMTDIIFLSSKITADGNCSHEIKRHLLLVRKPRLYIKKEKHHFAIKGQYSQNYGFSVVMYGCENWTIKKYDKLMLLSCGVGEDS